MFSRSFWQQAVERAAKSAAQAVLLYLGGDVLVSAWSADWLAAGGIAVGAAVLSLLTSIVTSGVGEPDSPSAVALQARRRP